MGFEATLPHLNLLKPDIINTCSVHIDGMTCNSCVNSIEGMLSTANGIKEVKVDLNGKEGVIQYLPNLITPKDIVEQISDMGFDAYVKTVNGKLIKNGIVVQLTYVYNLNDRLLVVESVQKDKQLPTSDSVEINAEANLEKCQLNVRGMTCGSCVAAIEKHTQRISGEANSSNSLTRSLTYFNC